MNIHEEIRAKSGSNIDVILAGYGIDSTEIYNKYQALYESGAYNSFLFGATPEDAAVADAYNELRKTVLNGWMSRISRDTMLGMINGLSALGGFATGTYLPGESLYAMELMSAWNEANPNDKPIGINSDMLP